MKNLITLLLLLVFGCSDQLNDYEKKAETSSERDKPPVDDEPIEPPANNWEWGNDAYFLQHLGISSPWFSQDRQGVLVTDKCPKSKGWRLFYKRLETSDLLRSKSTLDDRYPYFVLYNEYTGVLRIFIYMGIENPTGGQAIFHKAKISDIGNGPHEAALLHHENSNSGIAYNQKIADADFTTVDIYRFNINKWHIIDYMLSYDPNLSTYTNSFFRLDFPIESVSEIKLEGTLEFSGSAFLNSGGGPGNLIGAAFDYINKNKGLMKTRSENINDLSSDIYDQGTRLISSSRGGVADLGRSFHNFAAKIGNNSAILGTLAGGAEIVNGLVNVFTGGSSSRTEISFNAKGTMELSGTIKNLYSGGFIKFALPLVNYTNNEEKNPLKYSKNIGLFRLKKQPFMNLEFNRHLMSMHTPIGYDEIFLKLSNNPEFDVEINPNTGMELAEIKIQPVIKYTYSSYYFQSYLLNDKWNISENGKALVYKDLMNIDEFLNKRVYIYDRAVFGQYNDMNNNLYLKIYYKFRRKTNHNDIVEVIKTYKAQ